MTVSRVINGQANVRQATREAVNEAVTLLNFAPNTAARSLAGAAQIRLGLLYANPSSAYLSEFLCGALDQASRSDVLLMLDQCTSVSDLQAADHLARSGVDGILLPAPLSDSREVLERFAEAEIAVVLVGSGKPLDGVPAVGIDDYQAAAAMTRHLLELGHRRIGFIEGSPDQTSSARRLAGFRGALRQASVDIAPDLIARGAFTYRSGLDAASRLLDRSDPPSAVFASNDDMAAATVTVAHRRGMDVPRDLTVCGFDDTAIATTIWPELTTIRQPVAEMARTAVELLVRSIQAQRKGREEPPAHVSLDFALVRRMSDAPPPSTAS